MTKYFRIIEDNDYMREHYGYEGAHDEGDIVATENYNYECFQATDEEHICCGWISMDHVEEVGLDHVPLGDRTKEHKLAILTAHVDGLPMQRWNNFHKSWVEHTADNMPTYYAYRVVTPEIKRAEEIEEELKVLAEEIAELSHDIIEARNALDAALYGA